MTETQPTDTATMATRIGPVYDTAMASLTSSGTEDLLELETSDGHTVYPAFQFNANGIDPDIRPLIEALADTPRWSAALCS